MVPFVAAVLIWGGMLNSETGWINRALAVLRRRQPAGLDRSTRWVYPGLVIIGLWGIGAGVIINIAGLRSIPTELYDAAYIDGAGWWAPLRHITIPLMSPVIFYTLILGIIEVLQYFLVPLVLNNGTGEPGGSTLFYNLYLYKHVLHVPEHVLRRDAGVAPVRDHARHHPDPVLERRGSGSTTPVSADGSYESEPAAPPRDPVPRRTPMRGRGESMRQFIVTFLAVIAAGGVPLAPAAAR